MTDGDLSVISRAKPDDRGLDFEALRDEAVDLIQRMSGQVWTNFNYSDPGVTILEQLCYAFTELSYRSGFAVEELLADPQSETLPLRRYGLYPAPAILPCNPVTANDLRRLILDRVKDVANVWFTKANGTPGLWDLLILLQDDVRQGDEHHRRAVLGRVRDCYGRARSLCEDIESIHILRPVAVRIEGEVEIDEGADPADVMADLIHIVGIRLAPEPRKRSLNELLQEGQTESQIFNGPLMLRGFIDDGQLGPLPFPVSVDDLSAIMAKTDGVVSVLRIAVEFEGMPGRKFGPGDKIELPTSCILRLGSTPDAFDVRLSCAGARRAPQAPQVRRALRARWADRRQTFQLRDAYSQRYAAPATSHRDPAAYVSVQEQFPRVYGIGGNGLSPAADAQRQAQANQLRGYLLLFDQLMANFLSALASLPKLFSVGGEAGRASAWQSLRSIAPNGDALLKPDYEKRMAELVAPPTLDQEHTIVDLLLSLYGRRLRFPALNPDLSAGAKDAALKKRLRAKRLLLSRMIMATRDRGRGFNYRRPYKPFGASGVEFLSRIELGWLDEPHEPVRVEAEIVVIEVESEADADFGRRLSKEAGETIERQFKPVPDIEDHGDVPAHEQPLHRRRVASVLMATLDDAAYYRMHALRGDGAVALVCSDRNGVWWLIGHYESEADAGSAVRRLVCGARHHHRRTHGYAPRLVVVEWILLRHGGSEGLDEKPHAAEPYDFRITAVLSDDPGTEAGPGWRERAKAIVRANTPAHVAVDFVFLGRERTAQFERLHELWTHALRHGPPLALAEASRRLEHELRRHIERPKERRLVDFVPKGQ